MQTKHIYLHPFYHHFTTNVEVLIYDKLSLFHKSFSKAMVRY